MRAILTFGAACALAFVCDALKCRTESGAKVMELKNVFMNCVKRLERSYANDSQQRGYNQQNSQSSRGNRNQGYSISQGGYDHGGYQGNQAGYNDQGSSMNQGSYQGKGRYNDQSSSMNQGIYQGQGGYNDKSSSMNQGGRGRSDLGMGSSNRRRDEADQSSVSNEGTSEQPAYNSRPTTGRYGRHGERRNSGHRSQYNPNMADKMADDAMGENVSMSGADSGCVMHCFLQDMEMTGENGMPDRYMATHVMTKDVDDEELRDFLQESVEECFQLIYNENTKDKCEFSKNLITCLSEKARSNCDDWKEDGISF